MKNSAEHSWQLALFAISLGRFAESPVDMNRVVRMLLVHDIGEIDTRDTMFFAEEGRVRRKQLLEIALYFRDKRLQLRLVR